MIWNNTTIEESKKNGISGINGLHPNNVLTSVSRINDFETREFENINFDELLAKLNSYQLFICYLDYAVVIGRNNQGKPLLPPHIDRIETKFIQKLRIFNKEEEIFFWRTNQNGKRILKGRHRKDNIGEMQPVVEANQILFGTYQERIDDNFIKLGEERGTEVILPFSSTIIHVPIKGELNKDNQDNRIGIRTRNYIGYNEIGQAGYVDCRFVEFVKMPSGEGL